MRKIFTLITAIIVPTSSLFCLSLNQIKEVFHHRVNKSDISLEVGSVAMYLDRKPQVTVKSTLSGNEVHLTYVLPHVSIGHEVKQSIDRINHEPGEMYSVVFHELQGPEKGLQLTFIYDPRRIGVSYEFFDSIKLQKGIVFRVFNKSVIAKIRASSKPIIKTALCNPRIVIDCGHGGKDTGAVGYNDIKEKDITLQVGLQVAHLLKKKNVLVDLVRQSDRGLTLDERTTVANMQNANIFVSLHANSAPNPTASGIETYYVSPMLFLQGDTTLSRKEHSVIARELNYKYGESHRLACEIHQSLVGAVRTCGVIDRKIKHSVAQVLLGTKMPATLVELGFLTNKKEADLLSKKNYQFKLAHGIAHGILSYLGCA